MAAPLGYATFPGITSILSVQFTLSHGITPSVATMEITPERNFTAAGGTLTLRYGANSLSFSNCRVLRGSLRVDSSGQVISLAIADRRWKWAYAGPSGGLRGHYNFMENALPSGPETLETTSFRALQVKSARDLASTCLVAMGEVNFDVSQVPNDVYPETHWEDVVPAQALEELANQVGCRTVLKLNDTVAICRAGVGGDLPNADMLDGGLTITPPEVPDAIKLICGPTVYQDDIPLQAVGLDVDGKIKLIDELSYKPATGWASTDPIEFSDIPRTVVGGTTLRDLAQQSVFRWYRVHNVVARNDPTIVNRDGTPGPYKVPHANIRLRYIEQILPLGDSQVERTIQDGRLVPRPAQVFGTFYNLSLDAEANDFGNTLPGQEYIGGFQVDKQNGIVKFSEPMYKVVDITNATEFIAAANLFIRTSYSVREEGTWDFVRHTRIRNIPGATSGTGPRLVRREDIVHKVVQTYEIEPIANAEDSFFEWAPVRHFPYYLRRFTNSPGPVVTNAAAVVDPQTNYYLTAEVAKYQNMAAKQATYAGLQPIQLDGAIQQVGWTIGPSGTTTQASRNSEFSLMVAPYNQRRFLERGARAYQENTAEVLARADRFRQAQGPDAGNLW